jgi:hypothetical protein
MNMVVTVSSIPLVIMLLTLTPFSLNHAQGQISFPCPNGYQHNSLGLCEPIANLGPSLTCPDGYIRNPSGVCELAGGTSSPVNNATNQSRNQGSSLAQQQPNIGRVTPNLQQQPQQNQTLSQLSPPPPSQQKWSTYQDPSKIFVISYPSNWISDAIEEGSKTFRAPSETFSDRYEINAAVTLSAMGLPSQANTLQALTDHRLQVSPNTVQSQATTLAGLPAHMIMRELSLSALFPDIGMGSNQMMLEVWTVKDGIWYHITFMAPSDKFHQYLPIAQQMINSFQILS